MRFLFHIGVHKTGTTLIQKSLSENIDVLRKKRVFYVNSELPDAIIQQREVLRKLQNPMRPNPREDRLLRVNETILKRAAQADAHTILLSEENRIGFPIYTELKRFGEPARFYPRADECLRRVLCGLDSVDVQLILYKREFRKLLPSLYSEALRNLMLTETIDEFCRKIDFESLDYGALFNRIAVGAPGAELYVKQFSKIQEGGAYFLNDFLDSTGIGSKEFCTTTEIVREGVDQENAEKLRQLSLRRAKDGMNQKIARARQAILASPQDKSCPIKLPNWAVKQLSTGNGTDQTSK